VLRQLAAVNTDARFGQKVPFKTGQEVQSKMWFGELRVSKPLGQETATSGE